MAATLTNVYIFNPLDSQIFPTINYDLLVVWCALCAGREGSKIEINKQMCSANSANIVQSCPSLRNSGLNSLNEIGGMKWKRDQSHIVCNFAL